MGRAANLVQCCRAQRGDLPARLFHQIRDQRVEDALESLIDGQFGRSGGIIAQHGVVEAAEERHALAHLLERENARVEAVVQIGGQVGDLVGQIDELGFEGRELVEEVLGQLRVRGGGVVAGVLDDALAHAQGQVQPAKAGIALLEPGDDAQGVQIVVEAQAKAAQALVESLFAGVAEGRMADVVRQRQRLGQFLVQPQRARPRCGQSGSPPGCGSGGCESGLTGNRRPGGAKTCVLPARRRKARACRMRAASRAKGVRYSAKHIGDKTIH